MLPYPPPSLLAAATAFTPFPSVPSAIALLGLRVYCPFHITLYPHTCQLPVTPQPARFMTYMNNARPDFGLTEHVLGPLPVYVALYLRAPGPLPVALYPPPLPPTP